MKEAQLAMKEEAQAELTMKEEAWKKLEMEEEDQAKLAMNEEAWSELAMKAEGSSGAQDVSGRITMCIGSFTPTSRPVEQVVSSMLTDTK